MYESQNIALENKSDKRKPLAPRKIESSHNHKNRNSSTEGEVETENWSNIENIGNGVTEKSETYLKQVVGRTGDIRLTPINGTGE